MSFLKKIEIFETFSKSGKKKNTRTQLDFRMRKEKNKWHTLGTNDPIENSMTQLKTVY